MILLSSQLEEPIDPECDVLVLRSPCAWYRCKFNTAFIRVAIATRLHRARILMSVFPKSSVDRTVVEQLHLAICNLGQFQWPQLSHISKITIKFMHLNPVSASTSVGIHIWREVLCGDTDARHTPTSSGTLTILLLTVAPIKVVSRHNRPICLGQI